MDKLFDIIPWVAVATLSIGYWAQVWRIHVHREVRDLSMISYSLLSIGFFIMSIKAYNDNSTIFFIKQVATFIPATIVIFQIFIHKEDHWHDEHNPICTSCNEELELCWEYCAYCGAKGPEHILMPEYAEKVAAKKLKSVEKKQ